MRLRTRFVLLIALAALGPLALLGGVAINVSTSQVVAKITEVQARTADVLADHVGSWVDLQLRLFARQVSTFDYLAAGQDNERAAFLALVYGQNPSAQIVSLVDSAGTSLVPDVYLDAPASGDLAGRDVVDEERLDRFHSDVERVRRGTPPGRIDFSEPVVPAGRDGPVMVVVARLAAGATLAVELSLDPMIQHFAVPVESTERLALVTSAGQVVMGDGSLVDTAAILALPELLLEDVRYDSADGTAVLAASSPVSGTAWRVVVSEPLASTAAPARYIIARTAYVMGVSALASVVLGLLVSRQVTGPVLELRDAALAVAEGEFGRRIDSKPGQGELTELTHAFNFMSRRLQQDREVIAAKNRQIEAFNRELQERVEERTRQLREAQERLIRTARLAAVGEMGAGLAHELNNPLAGILGLAQVLSARAEGAGEAAMLQSIEEQTRRCSEIVARMQRFSRLEVEGLPLDREGWAMVDLTTVIEEVLGLVQGTFRDRGVDLARELAPSLAVRGDRGALAQALTQLLTSLRSAASPGARLHVQGHRQGNDVIVDLQLSGVPLRVGQDDWMASGMGFWAARQTLAAHGGVLEEPTLSGADQPTVGRWRVRLPGA